MLVLSRKTGQSLVLGGSLDSTPIRVSVLKTRGDTVQLGIEAPLTVAVHREEVYQRILAEQATPIATQPDAA